MDFVALKDINRITTLNDGIMSHFDRAIQLISKMRDLAIEINNDTATNSDGNTREEVLENIMAASNSNNSVAMLLSRLTALEAIADDIAAL